MTVLAGLFATFFTIGLFSFGGGYAVLSFLQQVAVEHGWMTTERFADLIAISQSTPGPIAINMATFVGYDVGGVPGALAATVAVSLPGMALMVLLAACLGRFYDRPPVQAALLGLRPAVVGLIAAAAWQIGRVAIVDWAALGIAAACTLLIARWNLHPAWLVLGSALAGILLF